MVRDNRWRHGTAICEAPSVPAHLRGQTGCRFDRGVFDAANGEEVFGTYLEQTEYLDQFKTGEPLSLRLTAGVVRTPYGLVAYIIWLIDAGQGQTMEMEQFLNPHELSTVCLLRDAGEQSHFKFAVIDSNRGEVAALVDYPNVFGFGDTGKLLGDLVKNSPVGDFVLATGHVMTTKTVADLRQLAFP